MMKTRFDYVLIALLLAYSLLIFSDGISEGDGTSIFVMFGFCTLIKLFSGVHDIEGVVTWSKNHRSQVMYLLFGVGFVTVTVVWRYFTERVPFVKTSEAIFGTVFFFTAVVVVAARVTEKASNLFGRSKETRDDDSQGGG